MFSKTCIRNKIIGIILFLIVTNIIGIYLICITMENNEIIAKGKKFSPLTYDYFMGMELTGDMRNSFLLNRDYPVIVGDSNIATSLQIIRKLHQRLVLLFIISGAIGIGIALYVSRSISKPILKIAHSYKNGDNLINDHQISGCKELDLLAKSFTKMQRDLLEQEEERSRQESVELTKTLAAAIAHEIKNPINTIGLTMDYIETNLSPNDSKKRYEFYKLFENMKKELARINKIVEGFLRLTVPDRFEFKETNVNEIIKEVGSELEPSLVKNNISMKMELDDDVNPILADEEKLKIVFSNLIINAIEAMPRGGEITIKTSNIDHRRIRVDVVDNGIGIEKDEMSKIFKPYYTTKKQGFGLGLPLILSIVQKHDGRLTVNSKKGNGTTFSILFPVSDNVVNS
ncbi:MAG: hypothetical protein DRP84_03630 [Spirochaetes bacterium]|nr:MAG: hypothetical protein DRP84_03630 [Spirochaetota bacterium]